MSESWQEIAIWAAGIAVVLFASHKAGQWMEKRGWIYYTKGPRGNAGPAMMDLQRFVKPETRHVIEAMQDKRAPDAEVGDGPEPGNPPSRSS